jgi:hypothetical protein
MNAPPILQNMGFAILGVVFFCVGIGIGCVTGGRTMKEFKDAQDTMSVGALKVLVVGGALTAVFLGTGGYGVIRFGGALLSQMGIG